MSFALSVEQQQKRLLFRRFADEELDSYGHFPRSNLQKAAQKGYMGLPLPREWGGAGEDFITYILMIEEISRVCASTGVIMAVHTSVGTYPLYYYGTELQKKRYLKKLASGELLGAFALTEEGAGSDAGALRATATRDKNGYRLNGCKLFITGGGEADIYTVFASTDLSLGRKGITAFLVEKGLPGFEVAPPEKKMGLHRSTTTMLHFSDLYLPAENRLGEEGEGFNIAMSLLDGGRIGIAAQGLGLARASIEYTAAWLKNEAAERGAPGQAARFTLASLATRLEAAGLLTYRAAAIKNSAQNCTREAAMAKVFATDLAMDAATRCIDLCGLAAMRDDHPLTRYFTDAKVTQIYEGSNQIQRIVIARELLKGF